MALRVRLTFETFESIPAISLARLLIDVQHLTLVVVASQIPERMPLSSAVFDPALQKYTVFIEMRPEALGLTEVEITRINKESPLWLEFLVKVPRELVTGVAGAFRLVVNRLYFPELEYRRKTIAVEREAEALRQERLKSFAAAIEIEKNIHDPHLRELFLRGLRSSLAPFETEHPRIDKIEISDED